MSNQCGQCAALAAENSRLRQVIAGLQQQIAFLQWQVSLLWGAVTACLTLLHDQRDNPTMPPTRLLQQVSGRLEDVTDELRRGNR